MDEVTTENILHSILGAILQVNCSAMDMELMNGCIIHMGTRLRFLGMTSESVAWELFACQSLRRLANDENHSVVMPRLARALRRLSVAYRVQLQYQEALRASEQSVEVWRYIFEGTSNFDNHVPFLRALAVHMDNLKHANQPESVLPLAEESVGIARADLRHTFEYYEKDDDWWEEDEFAGRKCCVAIFRYAQALAFARRPSDACSIATEGFEVLQALPKNAVARIQVGPYIDLLLDQMCIVSEGGGFTLEWLTGTVFLIRSLAQRYPQDFSAQFLSLLHAYTYLCAQDLDHEFSPQNLRAFLEPSSNTLTPSLPPFYHPLYQHLAGVVEDAISAFYQRPSEAAFDLVHNLFLAHSQSATAAFRQVVERISSADNRDLQILDWVVHTLVQLLNGPIGKAERPELVALLQRLWTLHGLQLVTFCHHCRVGSCRALWQEGLYTDTMNILTICLNASFHLDEGPLTRISRDALIIKAAVLWDMGRTADAIVVLTEIEPHVSFPQRTLLPLDNTGNTSGDGWFLLYCWMRIQLLRRATRSRELLDFVEQILSDPAGRIGTDAQSHLYCVLIRLERLELKQEMGGEVEETLSGVERIVEMCRGNAFSDDDREFRLCGLIYALVALGKCLAGVGRNDEALVACREAVSIYRENESEMWESFLVTTRKHEIGLMAYRALSIQLAATLGDVNDEAPVYAEEAVKMYRDLVALVPRHRPALAEALQSLARISQRDDGVALPACKEAVEILRDVAATEDYLLPMLVDALDQLQGYLSGHEDHDSEASVVRKEAADARRKMQMQFASTPTGELFRLPIHLSRLMRDESPSESSDDSEQTLVGGENGMDDAIEVDSDTTLVCNSDPPSPKLLDENENISVPDHEKHLSSLKETLYTPMEIRLRVAPIDMLLVVLGGLVVVLGVCVAVLLRRDGTRGGIHV
ncbi:hypothetical protein C8F01DRAFT_723377 [Mycena amicta]|nr:hypothetical protein C8F01DRAFT_723377 [Mycena amicta]